MRCVSEATSSVSSVLDHDVFDVGLIDGVLDQFEGVPNHCGADVARCAHAFVVLLEALQVV